MIEVENMESGILRFPSAAAWNQGELQAELRVRNAAGGPRIELDVAGATPALLAAMRTAEFQPGAIALPAGCGASAPGMRIILDEAELSGEEGAAATLRLVYRRRTRLEPDEDVAKGLHSRRIAVRWVERQEMIEHWAARKATSGDPFNGPLFALWLQEADPAAKIAYKVTRGDGDLVALDNTSESGGWKGSALTKAVAQRYAIGVQYAAQSMLQVEVSETWRNLPTVDARCNRIVGATLPEGHRPIYPVEGLAGRFTWIRDSDAIEEPESGLYARTVVYLGIPNDMRPVPAPAKWGDGPVDELLYERAEGQP